MSSENILQNVATYQMGMLAALQNYGCFLNTANTKFKDFQNLTANRGTTVTFDLPPRATTVNSLIASFQGAEQRVHSLTTDQEISSSMEFTAQQFIYNVEDYMDKFGMGMASEIGAQIESNIAQVAETAPYRFYGNGVDQIDSYFKLSDALARFRTFGAPRNATKGYLLDTAIPSIINTGLNQFALDRNNEDAQYWQVGSYDMCEWFRSNFLVRHVAGTEGQSGSTLTVVSVVKNADDAVVSITFSGTDSALDVNSVKANDSFEFQKGVGSLPDPNFLTFVGHQPTSLSVQFRATADAESDGANQVTVSIDPPLKASSGKNQNITTEILAGMQVKVLPTHRCGLLTAGNPLFVAMPRLNDQAPFPTYAEYDEDTGVSVRLTYGARLGQNSTGLILDGIWGKTLVPEYSMKLVFVD